MTANARNRLAAETSLYLRQHADNPIHWFAWGEDAFAAARAEGKPIFLSIGYSTCHWCHVMEGDSFRHDDVADVLNRHYVAVKVDREERPDVDAIYMRAVQAMTGGGGWPLTVILTPDLKPCWGATFLPRDSLREVLAEIARLWEGPRRAEVFATSRAIAEHIAAQAPAPSGSARKGDELLRAFRESCRGTFDPRFGGFGPAPKFPAPWTLMALLRIHRRDNDPQTLHMVERSLKAMMRGGLRDHVGGGFHRYSTDAAWRVPHFEKMLYDNAQLAMALAEAHQATGDASYAHVLRGVLDYALRDLAAAEGGFYAAEDADSEKTEGKFYVWSEAELRAVLDEGEWRLLTSLYAISPAGNYHVDAQVQDLEHAAGLRTPTHANILYADPDQALPFDDPAYQALMAKLRRVRDKRVRPQRDNKCLVGWNGLMLAALAKASTALGDARYLGAARATAQFLLETCVRADGRLSHAYAEGRLGIAGLLEDYAFTILGLWELFQADLDRRWFDAAVHWQEKQAEEFWDESGGFFQDVAKGPDLIIRTNEFFDGATPSGNAVSLINLRRICTFLGRSDWERMADRVLGVLGPLAERFPKGLASAILAIADAKSGPKTLIYAATGNNERDGDFLKSLRANAYLPDTYFATLTRASDNKPFTPPGIAASAYKPGCAYVCEGDHCHSPTDNPQAIGKILAAAPPLTNGGGAPPRG